MNLRTQTVARRTSCNDQQIEAYTWLYVTCRH